MDVRTISFAVTGPIERHDLAGLCERVCSLLEQSAATHAFCDVLEVEPNAVTVDALARLQLASQRYGCRIRLRGASTELLALVELMGLHDVLV